MIQTPQRRLALIDGGEPTFAEPVVVGRPNLPDRALLHRLLDGILDSNRLSNNGPLVRRFEEEARAHTGTRHAIATSNGTLGLELAIRALDLTGEVLVPSFTFVATAHALRWQGLQPRFVDIDPATHLIDPELLARHVTDRTTAILAVHTWGNPCDLEALTEVADAHGLALLFDAAHAFTNDYPDAPVGRGGDAEIFSFHATKFVQAFEGGLIATDSDEIAERAASMRNFGFTDTDRVEHLGTNGKMSEISAAMGLASLHEVDLATAANAANLDAYEAGLAEVPGISLLPHSAGNHNLQYVVAEVDPSACPVGRDLLIDVLAAENVLARRYFHPGVHRMEPYRTEQPLAGATLPVTEAVCDRVLVLPTGRAVTPCVATQVAEIVARAVGSAAELVRGRAG